MIEEDAFGATAPEPEAVSVVEAEPLPPPVVEAAPVETVAQETPAAPVAPAAVPPGYVPVQEVQRLRQRLRELELPAEPASVPDVFNDPDAYTGHINQTIQQAVINTKLDLSETYNRDRHGNETVDAARDWALERFAANPAFQNEVLQHRDPYGYVVDVFKREAAMKALGSVELTEIEQFRAWKTAQAALPPVQAAAPVATPPIVTPPPRSLATATSAGNGPAPKADAAEAFLASKF
jgi:hypothetical protein